MAYTIGVIREFKTKNFVVSVIAQEDNDMDLSFDEDGSVLAGLNSGKFIGFMVKATVRYRGTKLADDYLGGCIYESIEAFMDHRECGRHNRKLAAEGKTGRCGSYFMDMVHNVCQEARKELARMQAVKVRKVA